MSALYAGRCYAAGSDAATAMWSGVGPVLSTGSPLSVSTVEFTGGSWWLVTREAGVIVSSVAAPAVDFAVCDPGQSVIDGVALGFLVLLVWVASWAVRNLGRVAAGRGV